MGSKEPNEMNQRRALMLLCNLSSMKRTNSPQIHFATSSFYLLNLAKTLQTYFQPQWQDVSAFGEDEMLIVGWRKLLLRETLEDIIISSRPFREHFKKTQLLISQTNDNSVFSSVYEVVFFGSLQLSHKRATAQPTSGNILSHINKHAINIRLDFWCTSNIFTYSSGSLWKRNCPELNTFISKSVNSSMAITISQELGEINAAESPNYVMQPLFNEEATFPNLEDLRLKDYNNIWRGHVLEERFCKLKVLELSTPNQSAIFSWNFLIRLHNLENLVLIGSCWEEIFLNEELVSGEKPAQILPRLRELKLSKQSILTQIWKDDTQLPCPAFHNLETLEVSECEDLKKLVPSSVSFKNLKILEILKCPGLINLVTSSTAKSLVQLKKMRVCECEKITEIVAKEVGEANEVITFPKLTCLELDCLENLTKFCLESSAFKFPTLKEVIVKQCPKLKVFYDGVLSTPKLQRVKVTKEDEWYWKHDLNTTLQWLWREKQ
ncbi:hypothetical protein CJ030_MR8G022380 [Morella rubra]|uniref:Disease resistance protein At4g27190-like leucine-rich repeats domain-containing protein n=1 Tax=Morella rubra TaxID=262757 RepID=A0A6A1URX1_9ROSI|nr:hypothetical protein CJ030_MR8G022380 [Morella rubra]